MTTEISKYSLSLNWASLMTVCDTQYGVSKAAVIWAKILLWINHKQDESKNLSQVCHLFRTIILMRQINTMNTVEKISLFSPLKFEEPILEGKEFCRLALINQLPSFRFFQVAEMTGKDAIFIYTDLYKAVQLVSFEEFSSTFLRYFDVVKTTFNNTSSWLGRALPELANITHTTFLPYAQKLVLEPNVRCIIKGDLHGDLRFLIKFLKELQKNGDIDPNDLLKFVRPFYLIFLGDYVDRGIWGVEVIYLLMLLKIKNPEHVFLIRGNHEDPQMTKDLGFYQEYCAKFGKGDSQNQTYLNLTAFYNSLPVVLYLGSESENKTDFVQCCHGGMEWGYNPKNLLNEEDKSFESIGMFKRLSECANLPETKVLVHYKGDKNLQDLQICCNDKEATTPQAPFRIGFMWNEFNVSPNVATDFFQERNVFSLNEELTRGIFAAANTGKNTLAAVIRAHQHAPNNPLMKLLLNANGCIQLWNAQQSKNFTLQKNGVVTLLLSPDNDSGLPEGKLARFTFDTTLHLNTSNRIEDWKCRIINNEM